MNWFFQEGRRSSGQGMPGTPSAGAADTGRTDWERRMVERLRLGHYAWRTEQTYRDWARRFHSFMKKKELDEATGQDLNGCAQPV